MMTEIQNPHQSVRDQQIVRSPTYFGIASLLAACLAWFSVWFGLNQGPDGIAQNRLFTTVAIGLVPLFAFVCGLVGVAVGIGKKNWPAIVTSTIGLGMIGFEVWFLMANR